MVLPLAAAAAALAFASNAEEPKDQVTVRYFIDFHRPGELGDGPMTREDWDRSLESGSWARDGFDGELMLSKSAVPNDTVGMERLMVQVLLDKYRTRLPGIVVELTSYYLEDLAKSDAVIRDQPKYILTPNLTNTWTVVGGQLLDNSVVLQGAPFTLKPEHIFMEMLGELKWYAFVASNVGSLVCIEEPNLELLTASVMDYGRSKLEYLFAGGRVL